MSRVKDTAKPLWDVLFYVMVPQLNLRSSEDISRFGAYTTGDKGIDKAMSNQWIKVMIPIHRMIELYQDGAQIRIINESDTKIVYDYISDHLTHWQGILSNGINVGDAPVEDLIAMDNFAHAIYTHAKYHFKGEDGGSILGRYMANLTRINPQNLFTGPGPTDPKATPDKITINQQGPITPERDSMGEFFKNQLMTLRRN